MTLTRESIAMPIDSALHKACHNGKINEVISLLQNGDHDVNEIGAGKCNYLNSSFLSVISKF